MEKMYFYDMDNSDIDNAWVDVKPIGVTAMAELLTCGQHIHEIKFRLLQPSFEFDYSEGDYKEVLLSWSYDLGDYDDKRELAVEIENEYCYIGIKRNGKIDLYIQIKHQIGEGIVVDVFDNKDDLIEAIGFVTYDDIITGSNTEDEVA